MPRWQVQQDLKQWLEVLSWLAEPRRKHGAKAAPGMSLVSLERPSAEPERAPASVAGLGAAGRD
jgi:hypothetical protein